MNNEGGPQFELPPQPAEVQEQPVEGASEQAVEQQRPAAAEAGVGKRAPQPGSTVVADVPDVSQPSSATVALPVDQPAPSAPSSPLTADLLARDTDLIEKEWVSRVKAIVNQTQDDPHRQKQEMSKAKADYIQKRFNKIIRTDEATA